jgi:MOSC domain-containing protein YiiM
MGPKRVWPPPLRMAARQRLSNRRVLLRAMHVHSINTALPQEVTWNGQVVRTSIFKRPVLGPVWVHAEHLAGDGQADLRVHGGRNKAVYAYAHEHYGHWQSYVSADLLVPGAFGENLTTVGLLEDQVRVGDHFALGTAVLVATQPRQPCFKLGIRLRNAALVKHFADSGRSGIYFRVHQQGVVQAGDALTLLQPASSRVTVHDMALALTATPPDAATLAAILALPDLSASWHERVSRLLSPRPPA